MPAENSSRSSTSTTLASICTCRVTRSITASRYCSTRARRPDDRSLAATPPSDRRSCGPRLTAAISRPRPAPIHVGRIGAGHTRRAPTVERTRSRDRATAAALGAHVVDVKEARLELAWKHANDLAANRVIETRRLEDDIERLTNRDVLELAKKCLVDRRIGDDAETVPRTSTGRMSLIGVGRAGRSEMRRPSSSGCRCFRSSCVIGTGRNGAADGACCPRIGIGDRTVAIRAKATE